LNIFDQFYSQNNSSNFSLAPFVQSPQLVWNLSWEDKFWHHNEGLIF